jgi:hypothetical protein
MAVQFVVVKFKRSRKVLIDGEKSGRTNQTLQVGEGVHTFKLDGPDDYEPKWRRPNVTGTNPIMPMEVKFEPASE